jgi:hypothetical protein
MKAYHYPFLLFALLTAGQLSAQIFTRVASGPVVTTPGDSRSVNWIDVNGDNWIDLQITNGLYPGQDNFLYLNNGAGDFVPLSGDTIVTDGKPSDGATWADIDNDGDLDAVVVNWYGLNNMCYRNDGSGNFTYDASVPFATEGGYSETAAWGDYDLDGFVDLLVTNSAGTKKNFLHHSNGDGTFTKITSGDVANDAFKSRCVNWTDMDNDGDPDLLITNEDSEHENLYRNDGGGTFVKVTTGDLVTAGGSTMSASWGDIDNDGDQDVFLCNDGGTNMLFRNEGSLTFTRVLGDTAVTTPSNSFSSAWADIDNDADLDLYVTNAFKPGVKCPGFLYLNDGTGAFTRSSEPMTLDSGWTYGCAFGDYDNDGFQDLAVATCRFGGTDEPDWLYHNNGNGNHWFKVRLTGTLANRAAIGAVVRVRAVIGGVPVWQMREVSAQSGHCGQNDLTVHFGLGDATTIDSMVIDWPSKTLEFYTGLETNNAVHVIEGTGIVGLASPLLDQPKLRISPNPNEGNFSLEMENGSFLRKDALLIHDIAGRKVWQLQVEESSQRIPVSLQLPKGSYQVTHIRGEIQTTSHMLVR